MRKEIQRIRTAKKDLGDLALLITKDWSHADWQEYRSQMMRETAEVMLKVPEYDARQIRVLYDDLHRSGRMTRKAGLPITCCPRFHDKNWREWWRRGWRDQDAKAEPSGSIWA